MDISSARRHSIITLHQTGNYTQREIANYVKVPQSSVSRIIHLWQETGSVEPHRIGRPPTNRRFSTHDVRMLVRASKQDPKATAHQIQERTRGSVPNASIRTIQRYLRNNGRIAQRPSAAPVLSAINKKKRLQWARLHANWTAQDWSKVMFTDETYIDVASSRSHFVRRGIGEPLRDAHTTTRRAFTQRVMVWGCFARTGVGALHVCTQTMTASRYIDVLEQHLQPSAERLFPGTGFYHFQQDNAPAHKAVITRAWFAANGITTMEWPAYSPDLNPIENLWNILKEKVRRESFTKKEDLIRRVKEIWSNDPEITTHCQHLSDSMVNRIRECITNKGSSTHY